ncbi:MAG: DUF3857 domain-containing protein [Pseudarcicella sp.]|nr:DUF3857 domain-containing protein [Pseudarcicella sp.]
MKPKYYLLLISLTVSTFIHFQTKAQQGKENCRKAWEYFNNNDRKSAQSYFEAATKDPETQSDAYLGLTLLAWTTEDNPKAFEYLEKFYTYSPNPIPYLYALWSTKVMFDGYSGKITDYQLKFIEKLLADKRINGTMKAMIYGTLGSHYQYANQFVKANEYFAQIGAIDQWQVLGTFENTSASGFNKDFGALNGVEPSTIFKNKTGADIKWFTPPATRSDKWFDFTYMFDHTNAIMYAQTFVNSPIDQEVVLKSGCSGSMKIWMNDQLITNEITERNCDLDLFSNTIKLNKGFNRVLVQIGNSEAGRANFLIRITDNNGNTINGLSANPNKQAYTKNNSYNTQNQTFFAEDFFENEIKLKPNDIWNYILLAETYLRNDKSYESRKYLKKARELAPKSTFLSQVLIHAYSREENNTELTKEREFVKTEDPESYWAITEFLQDAASKNEFVLAKEYIQKLKNLKGENTQLEEYMEIAFLIQQNKEPEYIALAKKFIKKYPHSKEAVNIDFMIKSQVDKNPTTAIKTLTDYLTNNYDEGTISTLSDIYLERGQKTEAFDLLNKQITNMPYAVGFYSNIAQKYYSIEGYKSALKYNLKALELAPYTGSYWEELATTQVALGETENAKKSYRKAIYYQPNLFSAQKTLRELEKKTDLFEQFGKNDATNIFMQSPKADAYPNEHSLVLISDNQRIVYPEGATEEKNEVIVKILSQKGIELWKEYNIPYNPTSQELTIEKAELLKSNGSKIQAETNENQSVFTGLEAGDAIHVIYRLRNYANGMQAKHFTDRIPFAYQYPSKKLKYSLLLPKNYKFQYKTALTDLKPSIKSTDEYDIYVWETKNANAITLEPLMPAMADVTPFLEVSTLPNWKYVGEWYKDLAATKAKSDFEVQEVTKELFANKSKELTDLQKAKIIYEYIEKNINYLSVAFMQSGLVPQKASRTLSTKLGDCKDLSTLFVAMCNEVGVKANLVLVLTRENGDNTMLLPSINFNHCIAYLKTEGKEFFIELTDNQNAFGVLSPTLLNTNALIVPRENDSFEATLIKIQTNNRTKNNIFRNSTISVIGKDLKVNVASIKTGVWASYVRHTIKGNNQEEKDKHLSESLSKDFNNFVIINSNIYNNLDQLTDSVAYTYSYTVKNEINEIAGMQILKFPWSEKTNTLEFISAEKRTYPYLLFDLFGVENMKETITFTLPQGKKILELPEEVNLKNDFADYSLTFKIVGDKIIGTRELNIKKDIVAATDNEALKSFFNQITTFDHKQYAFK